MSKFLMDLYLIKKFIDVGDMISGAIANWHYELKFTSIVLNCMYRCINFCTHGRSRDLEFDTHHFSFEFWYQFDF